MANNGELAMVYVIRCILHKGGAVSSDESNYTTEGIESFEVVEETFEGLTTTFAALKLEVDRYGGVVDWHECSHGTEDEKPCVIAETYKGG
jgi:hypothetical protein